MFETLFTIEVLDANNGVAKIKVTVDTNRIEQEMIYTRKVGEKINLDLNFEEILNRVLRQGSWDVKHKNGTIPALK